MLPGVNFTSLLSLPWLRLLLLLLVLLVLRLHLLCLLLLLYLLLRRLQQRLWLPLLHCLPLLLLRHGWQGRHAAHGRRPQHAGRGWGHLSSMAHNPPPSYLSHGLTTEPQGRGRRQQLYTLPGEWGQGRPAWGQGSTRGCMAVDCWGGGRRRPNPSRRLL